MTITDIAKEEAEKYVKKNCDDSINSFRGNELKTTFEAAYMLGYNRGNEWHFVKDGDLPPSGETVLLYYGVNIMGKVVMSTGCIDCKGNWYKNVDEEPIMWKEIVLPELKKE